MKRKPIYYLFVLLSLSLIIVGCDSTSNETNMGIEPNNSGNGEGMIFNENEVDSNDDADGMIFNENEVDSNDDADEMTFENEEGSLVPTGNTPPEGPWLWTNSIPIYEGCPVEMSSVVPPADPPVEVTIDVFENGEILLIHSDAGGVELQRSTFSETASIYDATVEISVADGENLTIEYYLDFNVFEDGSIGGTTTSFLPEFESCMVIRGFTAIYIGD